MLSTLVGLVIGIALGLAFYCYVVIPLGDWRWNRYWRREGHRKATAQQLAIEVYGPHAVVNRFSEDWSEVSLYWWDDARIAQAKRLFRAKTLKGIIKHLRQERAIL